MRREEKSVNFFPFPDGSLPPCLHLHQAFNLQKISATLHSSCFQGVFLVFLHLFSCFLWMVVDGGCSNSLEMFYCHEFMFN